MDVSSSPRPRRAERESVVAARFGRRAVEPIAGEIIVWHDQTAKLWAKFNHLELHGRANDGLLDDIENLLSEIDEKVSAWEASLCGHDKSGRVADAKQSFGGVIDNLLTLRSRIRATMRPRRANATSLASQGSTVAPAPRRPSR